MPSIKKLSISISKSKQVSPSPSRTEESKPSDRKKSKKPSSLFKKSSKGSKKQAKDVKVLDDSDATDRTDFTNNFDEFTLEDGLFSCDIDKTPRTSRSKEDTATKSRRGNRQGSWIDSTWDGGASFNLEDNESIEDELDDSLYQLLDDEVDTPEQFKKLSLHNILVEEELSFQRSLVWNDDERE